MSQTTPIFDVQERVGWDFEAVPDKYFITTLAEVIVAAAVCFPDVDDSELFFEHPGGTTYDLILRKKHPVEFQRVSSGFQKHVCGYITLEQVKKEAQSLPDFEKYGFTKTKVLWEKCTFSLSIGD